METYIITYYIKLSPTWNWNFKLHVSWWQLSNYRLLDQSTTLSVVNKQLYQSCQIISSILYSFETCNPTNYRYSRVEGQTKTSPLRGNNPVYFKPGLTETAFSLFRYHFNENRNGFIITVGNFSIIWKWLWSPKYNFSCKQLTEIFVRSIFSIICLTL